MSLSVDFIAGLYNKHSCYADRLSSDELTDLHIPTALDASLRKWIKAKKDIVLLGNPGDGKTHLIRLVDDAVKSVNAQVILDATAEKDYAGLVRKWKAAAKANRPFCLAINQGPLNQLLAHNSGALPQLDEVAQQIRSLIYYDSPPNNHATSSS
jgi:energy-coupling factor transporter ATP-binding protein EcfA2